MTQQPMILTLKELLLTTKTAFPPGWRKTRFLVLRQFYLFSRQVLQRFLRTKKTLFNLAPLILKQTPHALHLNIEGQ